MANPKKVDVATIEDADWSFASDGHVMGAIRRAAQRASIEFDLVEREDAEQDALLWLSVRPERVAQARATADYVALGSDIYANALRPYAVAESNQQAKSHSLDKMQEDGWEL